ncbi:MAG: electron transport complex subunit RsxC [Gammaproteobacteria bacterium]|nr:electron transport complex subunit RsxC [Gammaproteobacteria bacterium]
MLSSENTFLHGIHPPDFKALTCDLPIQRLPFAPQLLIPLSQHAGKPSISLVKAGDEVVRGQPIAKADGFFSVPQHAPASGRIKSIQLMPSARGPKVETIIMEVFAADTQEQGYDFKHDMQDTNSEQLIQYVQDSGMVGLGGAAFPTHVKLKPPPEHQVDTLVANGCECEPYLTCDHRLMLEQPDNLLKGIRLLKKALQIDKAIIGIEDNKLDAVEVIQKHIKSDDQIEVKAVKTKYPQGAEKMLIHALLGRDVPPGNFPSSVGVSVFNVGTLTQLGELLPLGRGVIERVVTVSGNAVQRPGNYLVPIGTPIDFLLKYVGLEDKAYEVILGGPMMGMSIASLDVPVTKAMSGMLVMQKQSQQHPIQPCIRCGYCLDACPMMLNPSILGLLARSGDYEQMQKYYHLNDCFECGCCTYVCPAQIPLIQYFRIAKSSNLNNRQKSTT